MATENLTCYYSDLPSPMAYATLYEPIKDETKKRTDFSEMEINRIIEMAWEDRTPFDAIEIQFGLKESEVKVIMKKNLKFSSYKLWRIRVGNCKTKHLKKRVEEIDRFKCSLQRSISMNKISKRGK